MKKIPKVCVVLGLVVFFSFIFGQAIKENKEDQKNTPPPVHQKRSILNSDDAYKFPKFQGEDDVDSMAPKNSD